MTDPVFKVNLPKTDFPMRAGLAAQEPKWLEKWDNEGLYTILRQRENPMGRFVLHCGPPYANGNFHMGHALSYVLKDFVVRHKTMAGFDAPLVPGWDCHGLPIEWKVEENLTKAGKKKGEVSKAELRKLCRDWATQWIEVQKTEWRRMGVLANFDQPYRTMDFKNEADTVRILGQLVTKGLVTKNLRPVHWSIVEQTALAEAEIEYADHTSTAVHVAFPVVGKDNEYVVIWTTTPWTLPANKAVAYNAELPYVKVAFEGKIYYVAEDLLGEFCSDLKLINAVPERIGLGAFFEGWQLKHPFYDYTVPMLHGNHVTADAGTGFVHTAPSHGAEDFVLGKQHGLDLECHVGPDGVYDASVQFFAGQHVWKAEEAILEKLRENNALLAANKITHSYPVSWRSKKPLIFRTTPQWFITMGDAEDKTSLRARALKEIQGVAFTPASGINRITAMVADRPDWCISRQRAWGVPVTIFIDKTTGQFVQCAEAFEAVAKQIEKQGVDAWDLLSVEQLLEGVSEETLGCKKANLVKETDILDVWFDSGTTWGHVVNARDDLRQDDGKSDLYLEGSDQHRGWFQSSLLACVGARDHAPYKGVLTHGYVVDGEGKKMSKSLGNGMSPDEIYKEFGADIMRLWVATSDYSLDVRLSKEILKTSADAYRQIRNTLRYLVGNISDYKPSEHAQNWAELPSFEKAVLLEVFYRLESTRNAYDRYDFSAAVKALQLAMNGPLVSRFYAARKDWLYCDAANSPRRRQVQMLMYAMLQAFLTHLAPVLAFTADEAWREMGNPESLHLEQYIDLRDAVKQSGEIVKANNHAFWQQLLTGGNGVEELYRRAGDVKVDDKTARIQQVDATLGLSEGKDAASLWLMTELGITAQDIADVLEVAQIKLRPRQAALDVEVGLSAAPKCPRCWRHVTDIIQTSGLCTRCDTAEKQQVREGMA